MMTTAALWFLMNLSLVADWGQTRNIVQNPAQYHENNLLLGEHPSMGKVNTHFITALAVSNGIMIALPKKYRPYFAGGLAAVEMGVVVRNNSMGLKVSF